MKTALVLLLLVLCASGAMAQASAVDAVPLDHWAYDAVAHLDDATDGALSWIPRDRLWTRYEFAIVTMRAIRALTTSAITPEEAAARRLPEIWGKLAREFLHELRDLSEDIMFLIRDEYDGAPPRAGPPTIDSSLGDMATVMLRDVPGDHWLYAEVQRFIWADPRLRRQAPSETPPTPADPVPQEHWAYQALRRVAPLAFPLESHRQLLADRRLTRYEFAMVARKLFDALNAAEEPVQEPEAVEVTWALLALEFWPELAEMELTDAIRGVGEGHWLHETAQRVLAIAEGDGREGG